MVLRERGHAHEGLHFIPNKGPGKTMLDTCVHAWSLWSGASEVQYELLTRSEMQHLLSFGGWMISLKKISG
jgi:hypothetical protein